MEVDIKVRDLNNDELLSIYKILIEFVRELEKEVEKAGQEEVL